MTFPFRNPTFFLLVLMIIQGCNSDEDGTTNPGATSLNATSTVATVNRGPTKLSVDGDPNGLWWEASEKTLYVADDDNNRILRWTDTNGFSVVATLPEVPPNRAGLGQLVRLPDKSLVITRFGYGTDGTVIYVDPKGTATLVQGLDSRKRRIGLTLTDQGNLLVGGFIRVNEQTIEATVSALTLVAGSNPMAGMEKDVVQGLNKPVGVLAIGNTLYISDQGRKQIVTAPLDKIQVTPVDANTLTVFVNIEKPDLLMPGPNNSLFTGSEIGKVYQIQANGQIKELSSGYREVRGVAYDADNRRLFLSDHDPNEDVKAAVHYLWIIPVD